MSKTIKNEFFQSWLADKEFYSQKVLKDENRLLEVAKKNAYNLFKAAALKVPAYSDFLIRHKINYKNVRSFSDLKHVPSVNKSNYIQYYPLEMLCWQKDMSSNYMVSTSSGTSGEPHYWPRDEKSLVEGAQVHEYIFNNICGLKNKKSLLINGFALGNWIAGTFTSECSNLVSIKGYPITVTTPGYSSKEVLKVLKDLAQYYEKIVITGHTPFLKEMLEEAFSDGVDFKKLDILLIGTGQGITENWRDYMIELTQSTDPTNTFINLYGSADAALMGFETPLSIYLRRNFSSNFDLATKIFSDKRLPSLYQYDPRLIYFEEIEKELHITKYSGVPLIKYNIHDEGGVIGFSKMNELIGMEKISSFEEDLGHLFSKFPFVYLYGRDRFMVKIYGANIYSEHVQHALNHPRLQKFLTGRFILNESYDKYNNPTLICRIELSSGVEPEDEIIRKVKRTFIEEVRKINTEYDYVLTEMGNKTHPNIKLHKHGNKEFFPKGVIKKTA